MTLRAVSPLYAANLGRFLFADEVRAIVEMHEADLRVLRRRQRTRPSDETADRIRGLETRIATFGGHAA